MFNIIIHVDRALYLQLTVFLTQHNRRCLTQLTDLSSHKNALKVNFGVVIVESHPQLMLKEHYQIINILNNKGLCLMFGHTKVVGDIYSVSYVQET